MISGVKDIRSRMASVRDTQKITNAMYLIASAKLRKAREELSHTRPYFNALQGEIKRIFRTDARVENRYFYPPAASPNWKARWGVLSSRRTRGLRAHTIRTSSRRPRNWSKNSAGTLSFTLSGVRKTILSAARYRDSEELFAHGAEPYHAARARDRNSTAGGV